MFKLRAWRDFLFSDIGILLLMALARVLLQTLVVGQYGFHRDELATLDDARSLAWGYVAYPPLTPFIARLALTLFGPSLVGLRFFAVLAQGAAVFLTGLMARELGGSRWAQILASLSVALIPASLAAGDVFQYVTFDYLWWVLIAYLVIRLLKSEDARWFLGIGAVMGIGMMTKYTLAFFIAGVVGGVLLTRNRRHLTSPWLWGGVAVSLLIFLPNLVWQAQHQLVSLTFLSSIHARDVRIGRTGGFLSDQLLLQLNPLALFLAFLGLYFYLGAPAGQRYRLLGWMYVFPLLLFLATQGRGYYLSPAYPMLIAGGAFYGEQRLAGMAADRARRWRGIARDTLAVGGVVAVLLVLPLAPVNSAWWNLTSSINSDVVEEIGWPELVKTVAGIYAGLPAAEKSQAGILAGNYGEAGAVNLYGPAYGLPKAISGINSYWLHGYGDPPPQVVIVLGLPSSLLSSTFQSCELAGHVTNRLGVKNEETTQHPDIYVCRDLRQPWPDFWKNFQYFG